MVLHHLPDSRPSLAPTDPTSLNGLSRRAEGIPSEGDHGLSQRLVWNLPSLPSLGSTGLLNFPESSMPKILKGINSQILLLSQSIASVAELHERELIQCSTALHEEIAWLRTRGSSAPDEAGTLETRPFKEFMETPVHGSNHTSHISPIRPAPDHWQILPEVRATNGVQTSANSIAANEETLKDVPPLPDHTLVVLKQATKETSKDCPQEALPQLDEPCLWPVWSLDGDRASRLFPVQQVGDLHEVRHLLTKTRFAMLHKGNETRTWKIVIHPYSATRILWDLLGGCFILYDIVAIPLQTFEIPPLTALFDFMLWLTVLFWSIDIVRSFMVGYEHDGMFVLQMQRIVPRYLRTWFLLDITIVSIDWICLIALNQNKGTTSRIARLSKTIKALRIMRMIRLVRAVKLPQVFVHVLDFVKSAYGMAGTKLILLVLASFALIHVTGCYWYFLSDGELFATDGSTWVDEVGYRNKSFGFLYMSSVHWAVSQAGFTTTDIVATNTVERAYCLLTGIAWLHLLCFFLVQHMECVQMIKHMYREKWKQEQDVRSYLQKHGAPIAVMNAVLRFVRVNFTARMKRIHESDIPIMHELPIKMQIKLHSQIFLPSLKSHEAFARFTSASFLEMATVCHTCIREKYGVSASKLFDYGEDAVALFMFVAGTLHYFHVCGDYAGLAPDIPSVGDWICESALWLRWRHRGHLMCASSVEVLSVDSFRFQAVMADARETCACLNLIRAYARRFAAAIIDKEVDSDLWPTKSAVEGLLRGALIDANEAMEVSSTRSRKRGGLFSSFGNGAWGSLPFSP